MSHDVKPTAASPAPLPLFGSSEVRMLDSRAGAAGGGAEDHARKKTPRRDPADRVPPDADHRPNIGDGTRQGDRAISFNPLIAKLHIAKKQLGLDDASYRAVLLKATGKTSSKDMREAELVAAVEAMKKAGFKTLPPRTAKQKAAARKPYVAKIFALWGELQRSGQLNDPSMLALQSFVKRQTGMDRVEWLGPEDASKVTEGLKAWLMRLRKLPVS